MGHLARRTAECTNDKSLRLRLRLRSQRRCFIYNGIAFDALTSLV